MEASTETAGGLEQEIEELTERETFDPPEEFVENALISDESVHEEADKDPVAWWAEQAKDLHWFEEPTEALDDSNPPFYKWFADGKLNASYNCLDRHVEEGNGDRVALIWRGEEGEKREFTYSELLADVKRLANALTDKGVEKGDVVGIYLPMIPEVAVSMLACARIGAPHNVVFGGFSPGSVCERMEVSEAKALITTNFARRKGKSAAVKSEIDDLMDNMPTVETVIVVRNTDEDAPMEDGRDHWWDDVLEAADDEHEAEAFDAETPLFILYSSGSTSKPKGILHTTGGYLTGVRWTTKNVFDLRPRATCSGARPTSAGSPATRTSSTGPCPPAPRP